MAEMSIEDRVAAGAEWLDANRPGWESLVRLDELELADCRLCVLGQVFGHFFEAPLSAKYYDLDPDKTWVPSNYAANERGFNSDADADFPALDDAWTELITARRQVPDGGGSDG